MAARKLNSKNVRSSLTTRAASTKTIHAKRESQNNKYYWVVRDFKGRYLSKGRATGDLRTKRQASNKFKEDKTLRKGYHYRYDRHVVEITKKDAGVFKRKRKDFELDVDDTPDKRLKDVKGKTARNYSAKITIDGQVYHSRGRTKKSATQNLARHISKNKLNNDYDMKATADFFDSKGAKIKYSEVYYRKRKK